MIRAVPQRQGQRQEQRQLQRPHRSWTRRHPNTGRRRAVRLALLAGLLAVLAAGCGGSNQPSSVEWRNVTFELPDEWYLFEETSDRLSISNQDIGIGDVAGQPNDWPEGDVVAMFFTYEPNTLPADWRDLLARLGAEIETDAPIVLTDEVPATQLIYRYETEGVLTREMVVLIPSRNIVLLAQPVPPIGSDDVTDVFLAHLDEMMEVLRTARFGAPLLD